MFMKGFHIMSKKISICKLLALVYISAVLMLLLSACGKIYTCSECGKRVTEAYYDPFDLDSYFCKDCAKEYFAPFPYTSYRAG